jgi:hypothetical protein
MDENFYEVLHKYRAAILTVNTCLRNWQEYPEETEKWLTVNRSKSDRCLAEMEDYLLA